jgi:hypothetical protein
MQYQWGQSNLTVGTGTTISPNSTGTTNTPPSTNPTSPSQNQTGVSPNDGYSISGIGKDVVQSVRPSTSADKYHLTMVYSKNSTGAHKCVTRYCSGCEYTLIIIPRFTDFDDELFPVLKFLCSCTCIDVLYFSLWTVIYIEFMSCDWAWISTSTARLSRTTWLFSHLAAMKFFIDNLPVRIVYSA